MKRASRIYAAAISVAAAMLTMSAIGCATATGEISGGDPRFDAAALSNADFDAGPLFSTGHTWEELYADYFGNPNRAACAGNGSCHGDAAQLGAQTSSFICALNAKDDCYKSITSDTAALVQTSDPANSPLVTQVLRHADGSVGNMPRSPAYGFSTLDLQRITDWISAGAPNDAPVDSGPSTNLDAGDAD